MPDLGKSGSKPGSCRFYKRPMPKAAGEKKAGEFAWIAEKILISG
jgi:hypothetical protein